MNGTPSNPELETPASRRGGRSTVWLRTFWTINIVALCGLAIWIFCDGRFTDATRELWSIPFRSTGRGSTTFGAPWYIGRVMLLRLIGILVAGSAFGIFLGLFFGAHSHRRLRSWFAFTMLIAAWLTLFASWRELAWQGQALRLVGRLAGFETIADDLRKDWPTIDGERTHIGPFMAYPIGQPTMIMMLTTPEVPNTRTSFSSVEQGDGGILRFELVGDEPGVWLEWHPPGSVPQSFVGGLMNNYLLERYSPLTDRWYLVRYQPSWRMQAPAATQ